MKSRRAAVLAGLTLALVSWPAHGAAPRLLDLPIPGPPEFAVLARDVMDVTFAIDPSTASGAGLFEDAGRLPSYSDSSVTVLEARLQRDLNGLKALPWRSWPVSEQVDFRWIYANAEVAQRSLQSERLFLHRPGCWLEPTANNLIALTTYDPADLPLQTLVIDKIPAMVAEIPQVCKAPTRRDVHTAQGLIKGLLVMLRHPAVTGRTPAAAVSLYQSQDRAATALRAYRQTLDALHGLPEYQVIGAENYAWRYQHVELLPWTPPQLLAMAHDSLVQVDKEMATLRPRLPKENPATAHELVLAKHLSRDTLLHLYDQIPAQDRKFLEKCGIVTIPPEVGPIFARETPDAMVPLTGDGGSMDPPPAVGDFRVGWWNVEHFHADWDLKTRLDEVRGAVEFRTNGMGPYSAHEGLPGHHLQLSIARFNPDPIRKVMTDAVQNEGWALYAEEMFWQAGGLGPSVSARYNTLASFRHRIKRVIYDINVETGHWTLQQAADFRHDARPGHGRVDEDLLRSINWPTQLIAYYTGKMQILQLKADYRTKLGSKYSDRAFHDALLKVGSIPFAFARCEMLGEPVPDL